ncbi:MAG: putative thiol peroxidase [Gammaproteobacteria bacterium]|nr:MAG: putative thiol peroxidase [Gammaproteobacteria bacterium]
MATIHFKGTPVHTHGELPTVGSRAPDFRLVRNDLADVSLADFAGKRKVLSIFPSLDTSVCLASARRFNAEAQAHPDVWVLLISADLPFAQRRVCQAEGLDRVVPLSMMRSRQFAKDYGVLLVDGPLEGITARAVLVLDETDTVRHAQLVDEIAAEPDYAAALAAL